MNRLIAACTVLLAIAPCAIAVERAPKPRPAVAENVADEAAHAASHKAAHKADGERDKAFRELAIERNRRECALMPLTREECEKLVQADALYETDDG